MDREDSTAGLARLEGYLMSQAALHDARLAGDAFARDLTWLGPHEQAEVSRRFADHHLALRREMLHTVIARARELRAEYSRRYRLLRRRTLGLALAGVAVLVTTTAWIDAVS
ncbi:hypothetical protein [Streptomyces sp. NPDC101132]|uniref:hypothetical protein n=1 Tax=Streptomyces sp. NPDC101132 TaxID=3366110 RepID=UPI0038301213